MSSEQTKHPYYRLSVFRITKTPLLQSPKMLTKVVDFLGGGSRSDLDATVPKVSLFSKTKDFKKNFEFYVKIFQIYSRYMICYFRCQKCHFYKGF